MESTESNPMNQWHLKVQASGPRPEVQLRHESGLCRGWSGDIACRLCRSLGLHEGEQPCPKQQAWRLFLFAHAIEDEAAPTQEAPEQGGDTACEPACRNNCPMTWEKKLADHGLAPTPARTTIAAAVLPHAQHVTVDDVEHALRDAGQKLSRTRIRKTLQEFVDWDLLQVIDVGDGAVFYDTDTSPHAHVYNMDTGELTDLRPEQAWITGLPELPRDVRLEAVQLVFRVRQASSRLLPTGA